MDSLRSMVMVSLLSKTCYLATSHLKLGCFTCLQETPKPWFFSDTLDVTQTAMFILYFNNRVVPPFPRSIAYLPKS